ncbi:MAG: hypothetical protein QM668_22715, partial [Agriterribacter sp.]
MATHHPHCRINANQVFVIYFIITVLCTCCLYARSAPLHSSVNLPCDTASEEKIDYIERIYFSGKKKDDLNVMILTTLQDLEGAQATTSVAKQYAFLSAIKDQAAASKSSCELLEILAVGAYALDAKEASEQQVLPPGNAAKANTGNALQSINNTFGSMNSSMGSAAYDSWVLSGGKVNAFGAANTVSKIAGATNSTLALVSTGTRVVNEAKAIGKMIGLGNGPCKKVPVKDIPIGKHEIPQQGAPQ